ncbi:hypothetical protein E1K64_01515 [Salmonella enterica subsp. enterica serovar Poona]|nr:hypothetical protein [Salmonella enterica subsp. enterica serovar Poona]
MKWLLLLIPLFFYSFNSYADVDTNQCASAQPYHNVGMLSQYVHVVGIVPYAGIDGCEYYASEITFGSVQGTPSIIAMADWTPTHKKWADSVANKNGNKASFNSSDLIHPSDKPDPDNPSSPEKPFEPAFPSNEPVLNCQAMKDYLTVDSALFSDNGGVYNGCLYNNKKSTIDVKGKQETLQTSVFSHQSVDFSQFQGDELSLSKFFSVFGDYNSVYTRYLSEAISSGNILYKRIFAYMQAHKEDLKNHPNDFNALQSFYGLITAYVEGFVSLRNQYNNSDFKPGVAYNFDDRFTVNYYVATRDHEMVHCWMGYTNDCNVSLKGMDVVKVYALKKDFDSVKLHTAYTLPFVDISGFHFVSIGGIRHIVSDVQPVFNESHFLGVVNFLNSVDLHEFPHNSYVHAAAFLSPSTPLNPVDSFMDFSLFPNKPDESTPPVIPDKPPVTPDNPPDKPGSPDKPGDSGGGGAVTPPGGGGSGGGMVPPPSGGGDTGGTDTPGGGSQCTPGAPGWPDCDDQSGQPGGGDKPGGSGSGGDSPGGTDKPGGSPGGSGGGHGTGGDGHGGGSVDGDGDALLKEVQAFHRDVNEALKPPSGSGPDFTDKDADFSDVKKDMDKQATEQSQAWSAGADRLKSVLGSVSGSLPSTQLDMTQAVPSGITGVCRPWEFDIVMGLPDGKQFKQHVVMTQFCTWYDTYIRPFVTWTFNFLTGIAVFNILYKGLRTVN